MNKKPRPYDGTLFALAPNLSGDVVIVGMRPEEGGTDIVAKINGANFHDAADTALRLIAAYEHYGTLRAALTVIANGDHLSLESLREIARRALEETDK